MGGPGSLCEGPEKVKPPNDHEQVGGEKLVCVSVEENAVLDNVYHPPRDNCMLGASALRCKHVPAWTRPGMRAYEAQLAFRISDGLTVSDNFPWFNTLALKSFSLFNAGVSAAVSRCTRTP